MRSPISGVASNSRTGIAYFWYVQETECQATPAGQQDQPAGQSHRDRWLHHAGDLHGSSRSNGGNGLPPPPRRATTKGGAFSRGRGGLKRDGPERDTVNWGRTSKRTRT